MSEWIRFKKRDLDTWPADGQRCVIKLAIKNKATGDKRTKIIENVFFNKGTHRFCHVNYDLTVSIPTGADKTKIYYQPI